MPFKNKYCINLFHLQRFKNEIAVSEINLCNIYLKNVMYFNIFKIDRASSGGIIPGEPVIQDPFVFVCLSRSEILKDGVLCKKNLINFNLYFLFVENYAFSRYSVSVKMAAKIKFSLIYVGHMSL